MPQNVVFNQGLPGILFAAAYVLSRNKKILYGYPLLSGAMHVGAMHVGWALPICY